jgi:hypothetical protein
MKDHFGVVDVIARGHVQRTDEILGDLRLLEAFDGPASVADEMRVLVASGGVGAKGVSPGAVFAVDPVYQLLLGEGVERAVHGDRVGVLRQPLQHLRHAEGLTALAEHHEHRGAHWGAAQAGTL